MKTAYSASMACLIWKSYKTYFDPVLLFNFLHEESKQGESRLFFLDSSMNDAQLGRYSFAGTDPFLTISGSDPRTLDDLGAALAGFRCAPGPVPFTGGALGFLSYDYGLRLEPSVLAGRPARSVNPPGIPAAWFGFYNTIYVFDHYRRTVGIAATGFPETRGRAARLLAEQNARRADAVVRILAAGGTRHAAPQARPARAGTGDSKPESGTTKRAYIELVRRAQEHIRAGDIYQVNLAHLFACRTRVDPALLYRRLRAENPSFFGAYLDIGGAQVISSSPESFLRKRAEVLLTRPMKGTRPRGADGRADAAFRRELMANPKERAELMMIVDLMRSDLGRVCRCGSVSVPRLRQLETYATVHQTTATVRGRVRPECGPREILRACFPGGSITGCPKIRAMQIIEQLEEQRRGLYTGSLGYISFAGDMDFNILIRTMIKCGDRVHFGAGSGIVADSDPAAEYDETLIKAAPMIRALGAA